jgi:hypothetical protein
LLAALSLTVAASLVAVVGATTVPARATGYSPLVDAPVDYEPQTTCTSAPRPGTVALATWLMRTYRVTGSMGMMRGCKVGGTSEHKDGRAFDWAADVRKKAQRRAAFGFIRKALATDSAGNAHALARRMGIMYLIYNDTIWSSYRDFVPRRYLNSACKTRRKCSRTLRHKNHVHISLGYAGAAAQTSWYREHDVPSEPVLHVGTHDLDADQTALTAFTVPVTGATLTSPFFLRAGVTYRLVATGTARYGPAPATGDANCVAPTGAAYQPSSRGTLVPAAPLGWSAWSADHEGSEHPASAYALPAADTSGLLVNGALRWEGGCQADHTSEAWFTPTTRQRLQLRYADPTPADDDGTITVYLARDDITRTSLRR